MPPALGLIATPGASHFTNLNSRVQKNSAQSNVEGTNMTGLTLGTCPGK